MISSEGGAWLFLTGAVAAAGLHLALILGAPIGYMTMGGRNPGVLPASARIASAFQGVLVLVLALIVMQAAGVISVGFVPWAKWLIWVIVAIGASSLVANTITPSKPERWFGIPVALALLLGSLTVALSV
ncbi:hypothetical protein NBRC116594_22930 [Shimia sp. NS0008-38b]|uniref:hypothetical protein n=1 Tax=Shimia sp. NS0008-38b TaxID=3127653 RepID=UPI0031097980